MTQPTPPPFQPTTPKKDTAARTHKTGQPLPPGSSAVTVAYENNPFTVAASGIDGLFKYAKVLAIVMLVLSLFGVLGNAATGLLDRSESYSPPPTPAPLEAGPSPSLSLEQVITLVSVVGGILLIVLLISFVVTAIFTGLRDVAAAAVANQKPVSFGEAFNILFSRFGSYLGLQALIWVKVFLWSLLFIIPGLIMAIRYSLAGTAFFARNMKAGEAVAHSTAITKGGWFTTVASYGLFNLITLGLISPLIDTGVRGILYRQFDAYQSAELHKPSPHGLTIAYFVIFILLILAALGGLVLMAALAVNGFSE